MDNERKEIHIAEFSIIRENAMKREKAFRSLLADFLIDIGELYRCDKESLSEALGIPKERLFKILREEDDVDITTIFRILELLRKEVVIEERKKDFEDEEESSPLEEFINAVFSDRFKELLRKVM